MKIRRAGRRTIKNGTAEDDVIRETLKMICKYGKLLLH
jgi:hypothetical protein